FYNEAVGRHQEYGDIYDALWSDCEEANPFGCTHGICQQKKAWLQQKYIPLYESRNYLLQSADFYLKSANDMISNLLSNDLPAWKRALYLKQMDFPMNNGECLQQDFEQNFESLGILVTNIKQLSSQILTLLLSNQRYIEDNEYNLCLWQKNGETSCITFKNMIRRVHEQENYAVNLIKALVSNSLVVTIHPSDPVKQNKTFATEVILLKCGQFSEDVKLCVQAQMIKENDESGRKESKVAGVLLNNMAHLSVKKESPGKITATFASAKISGAETRKEGKNADTKAVEKTYALFYQLKNLSCRDIGSIDVHTCSGHFSYMVHTNQSCSANAMAFWKIALIADGKSAEWNPVEDCEVSWPAFEISLDYYFRKNIKAERGLLKEHFHNFGWKLLGHPPTADDKISYQRITKQILPELKTTFWEWYYEAMRLVNEELVLKLWKEGWMAGFISKADAEDMLLRAANPSFLFRISDSQLGALSLVVRHANSTLINHLAPFNAASLKSLPLSETIECEMMRGIDFLESYGQSAIPRQTVLDVLKKGKKQKEALPVSGYCGWRTQVEWDHIPKLPQMMPVEQQIHSNSQPREMIEVDHIQPFHQVGSHPAFQPMALNDPINLMDYATPVPIGMVHEQGMDIYEESTDHCNPNEIPVEPVSLCVPHQLYDCFTCKKIPPEAW
uniref:Signal transducer and activator of transcription n=1 Tax=Plectus sambesii TaxID=2011161 RepID=A0A914V0B0_9BILA